MKFRFVKYMTAGDVLSEERTLFTCIAKALKDGINSDF